LQLMIDPDTLMTPLKVPSREEAEALEAKFQIGAHHAVTRLAEALEEVRSANDCRRLADTFADVIGTARTSGGNFDLWALIAEAKRRVKEG